MGDDVRAFEERVLAVTIERAREALTDPEWRSRWVEPEPGRFARESREDFEEWEAQIRYEEGRRPHFTGRLRALGYAAARLGLVPYPALPSEDDVDRHHPRRDHGWEGTKSGWRKQRDDGAQAKLTLYHDGVGPLAGYRGTGDLYLCLEATILMTRMDFPPPAA